MNSDAVRSSSVQTFWWFGGAVLGIILGAGVTGLAPLAEPALTPCLIALLFLTFLEIPFDAGLQAVRDLRFLTVTAVLNFIVVPLVVAGLIAVFDIADPLLPAVLIVLLCPCIDYVIAFTRAAGGAADRLLMLTPVLMIAQLLLLPVMLWAVTGGRLIVDLPFRPLVGALLLFIIIPLTAAVVVRLFARRTPRLERPLAATTRLMDPVMALTLLVITASVAPLIAGSAGQLVTVAIVFTVFAIIMTGSGWFVTRVARLGSRRSRAVILSGVTCNSLVMLPIVRAITGEGAGPAGVVTQTLIELLVLIILVRVLPRLVPDIAVSENR
ncbi:Arsenite efflux pump ArsB, ACR3 family [Brevibacterium siliguriense]|uniref:Arsenite efflux pump ArsB, ACR3 family n=2 Tax=Brevibacterium siliguriense TaxID=1136497 RepID=A0A1H1USE0_9MICO|nr:Arsenite efflux pump ArsB, ACR3 family [Brevibacterium siliguriense]